MSRASLSQSMPPVRRGDDLRDDYSDSDSEFGGDHRTRRHSEPGSPATVLPSSPFKPYSGDIFGTQGYKTRTGDYLPGMLYLSRMKVHKNPVDAVERFQRAKEEHLAAQAAAAAAAAEAAARGKVDPDAREEGAEAAVGQPVSGSASGDGTSGGAGAGLSSSSSLAASSSTELLTSAGDTKRTKKKKNPRPLKTDISSSKLLGSQARFSPAAAYDLELQSKRDCAAALCSLVGNEDLKDQVLEDGMIEAFTQLASTSDAQIRLACSRALCRLSGNQINWDKMIEDGAINALMSLSTGLDPAFSDLDENSDGASDVSDSNGEKSDDDDGSGGGFQESLTEKKKKKKKEKKKSQTNSSISSEDTRLDWATQLCAIGVANLACMEGSETAFFQAGAHLEMMRKVQVFKAEGQFLLSTARLLFNMSHVDGSVLGVEQLAQSACLMAKTVGKNQKRRIRMRRHLQHRQLKRQKATTTTAHHASRGKGWVVGRKDKPFMVEMAISCKDLADLDELSGSDPMCVLQQRTLNMGPWFEAGRTEVIQNDRNPTFRKRFHLVCHPEESHYLKFDIYDVDAARAGGTDRIDLTQQDFGGTAFVKMADLLAQPSGEVTVTLGGGAGVEGTLTVRATVLFYGDERDDASDDRIDDDPKKYKEVRQALMAARREQKVNESRLRHFAVGTLFIMSHIDGMPINLLHEGALETLREILASAEVLSHSERLHLCAMVAAVMYVMSLTTRICWFLVEQGGFQVLDIMLAEAQKCKFAARDEIASRTHMTEAERDALDASHAEAIDVIFMCMGTLSNIALEERCRKRMLNESAARTLIALAAPGNGPLVRSACATAIRSLASSRKSALVVTKIGGLDALISMSGEENKSIRRECFLALCTILSCDYDELVLQCGPLKDVETEYESNHAHAVRLGQYAKNVHTDRAAAAAENLQQQIRFTEKATGTVRTAVASALSLHDSRVEYMNTVMIKVIGEEAEYESLCSSLTLVSTLYNISCSMPGRKLLLTREPGASPNTRYRVLDLLLRFASNGGPPGTGKALLARTALQTVFNLSCCTQGIRLIIESGRVMRTLIRLLDETATAEGETVDEDDDPLMVYISLSILYNISSDTGLQNCRRLVSVDGAVECLIARARNAAVQTTETNALCAALLCRLSTDKTIVEQLVNAGIFSAIIAQSHTNDRNTKERCAVTISLMADGETQTRKALVEHGALPILMNMSGSHDPRIRQNSVAALCELTSCVEVKEKMVDLGAVKSLVLTGLIRVSEDDPATCNSCCKALYNLLSTDGKFEQIIADGVVWALTTMLGLTKEMRSLGMVGLANIASNPLGRIEMSNKNTLKRLTSLALTKNPVLRPSETTRATCAMVLHNLVCGCSEDARLDPTPSRIEQTEATLGLVVAHNGMNALGVLSRIPNPHTMCGCVAALAVLATYVPGQERFMISGGMGSLCEISGCDPAFVGTRGHWAIMRHCAIAAHGEFFLSFVCLVAYLFSPAMRTAFFFVCTPPRTTLQQLQ